MTEKTGEPWETWGNQEGTEGLGWVARTQDIQERQEGSGTGQAQPGDVWGDMDKVGTPVGTWGRTGQGLTWTGDPGTCAWAAGAWGTFHAVIQCGYGCCFPAVIAEFGHVLLTLGPRGPSPSHHRPQVKVKHLKGQGRLRVATGHPTGTPRPAQHRAATYPPPAARAIPCSPLCLGSAPKCSRPPAAPPCPTPCAC